MPSKEVAEYSAGITVNKDAEFRRIWDEHAGDILRYIHRRGMPNDEDAEDLWIEIFTECYRNLDKFREESDVRTWLYGIANNLYAGFYRDRSKIPKTAPLIDHGDVSMANPESDGSFTEPEARCIQNERNLKLKSILNQLSEDHKMVIILRQVQKLSVKETAQIMKRSEDAIKMLHLRATKNLTELMQKDPYFSNYMPERGGK